MDFSIAATDLASILIHTRQIIKGSVIVAKATKRQAPTKPCPECGKPIHARKQSHEECGWAMETSAPKPPETTKASKAPMNGRRKARKGSKNGRLDFPFGANSGNAGDLASDIRTLRAIKARLGAEVIRELLEL